MSKSSGYTLMQKDAEVVLGMSARGDNKHDIAAWFGVNQARVAEVEQGKGWGGVRAASPDRLPPRGAPGPKGRRLREAVGAVLKKLEQGEQVDVTAVLTAAVEKFDANEA
ncbi:hypothetical protein ACU4GA_27135 [Methylobacterium oryzae CBMB20]